MEWTKEDDALLVQLCKEYRCNWEIICEYFPGRSKNSCRLHCTNHHRDLYQEYVLKRRYLWTMEETITFAALNDGQTPLSKIFSFFPDRDRITSATKKKFDEKTIFDSLEIRHHENNVTSWTPIEDQTLVEQRKANASWTQISKVLSCTHGDTDCRTRWHQKFWEEFNSSVINGRFDVERFKKEFHDRREGKEAYEDKEDREENGGCEEDAEGDTDYEEDWAQMHQHCCFSGSTTAECANMA